MLVHILCADFCFLSGFICIFPAMSNFVFETSLSETEKTMIRQRAHSGLKLSDNGHLVVDGHEKNVYAYVRVYLRGTSYLVNRSRLCYFANSDFAPLPPNSQLSHLCHVRNCCRDDHITMEPPSINLSRKPCFKNRACKGHDGHPNCLF